jgi:phytoene dehydrogenase-like protein
MIAAALAQRGRRVAVFEKLRFAGGRYTQLTYRGAAVTTAAWTSLGRRSHIGRFLADLGIGSDAASGGLRYISLHDVGLSEQFSLRFADGRHYPSPIEALTPQARQAWMQAIVKGWRGAPPDVSAHDYIAGFCDDPDLLALVDAVTTTATAVSSRAMPASEYVQITLDGREAGTDFAMPSGGVATIVNALVHALKSAGGEIFLRAPVGRILVADGQAQGIELADGRQVAAEVVAHNAGPARLIRLLGADTLPAPYVERLRGLKGADCAAIFFGVREALFDDAPMLITPGCRRVVGIFSPTRIDPSLSRDGLHLYNAFLPLHSADRTAELALAMEDLRTLFPTFDGTLAWHVPMIFTGGWPGAESSRTFGQTGDRRLEPTTPIHGLYLVGMDVQCSGVAGDLIPVGVRKLLATVTSG